jgi:hypothetical protein
MCFSVDNVATDERWPEFESAPGRKASHQVMHKGAARNRRLAIAYSQIHRKGAVEVPVNKPLFPVQPETMTRRIS